MATGMGAKSFTVRFPEELHQAVREVATSKRMSLNALMQTITEAFLQQEEERLLYESYTRLGEDLSESDVEYAWDAQRAAIDLVNTL